ncbi:MAG: DUF721 domain-containing protein [Halodesulfovibrio sp.]
MEQRIGEALDRLLQRKGAGTGFKLAQLWRNWDMIMGEELRLLAIPLGHRKTTLIIGAEDNMAQQELTYYTYEIIERVNAFLDEPFFDRVQVDLLMGKSALDELQMPSIERYTPALPPRPTRLGNLLGKLDPASPVTRCYEKYVRMFDEAEQQRHRHEGDDR